MCKTFVIKSTAELCALRYTRRSIDSGGHESGVVGADAKPLVAKESAAIMVVTMRYLRIGLRGKDWLRAGGAGDEAGVKVLHHPIQCAADGASESRASA